MGDRARLLHESRVAYRDIFLSNGQDRMLADFAEIDRQLRRQQGAEVSASQAARHTLELACYGMVLAGLLALPWLGTGASGLVLFLGVIGLGSLRLLPHTKTCGI